MQQSFVLKGRGGGVLLYSFFNLGVRKVWVVNTALRPL
jgi:hypothetical protein